MRLQRALCPARASPLSLLSFALLALSSHAEAEELKVEATKNVTCTRKTHEGDVVNINYRGVLKSDNTVFDDSYKRGSPIGFELGAGQVIQGFDVGSMDMCIGEARRLTIPPELAYGESGAGPIPPKSTLLFDIQLMGIEGVTPDKAPTPEPPPPLPPLHSEEGQHGHSESEGQQHGIQGGPKNDKPEHRGECRLLGPFALVIQGALGALALLSLVWKRWRESPRRPVKVWSFDVSKQVVGSILLHLANLFMSMLSSGDFQIAAEERVKAVRPNFIKGKDMPNPCSFYLLNLAIDTTLGIPILVFFLRLYHALFLRTAMANPPESIKSGNYGQPPRATWWLKQSLIYFLGLFSMKLCVFFIFQVFPWLGWVGDWALRWTEGNEAVQIAFVMFIFPVVMNAIQYYIIDSFIKDTSGGDAHYEAVGPSDEDDERRRLQRDSFDDDSEDETYEHARGSRDRRKQLSRASTHEVLKEANPLPVPEYQTLPGDGGSSSSPRSLESTATKELEPENR
ncbi:FK506-binding protein 2 precursor [Phyllosticta citribraziliensis]|uniref:peptidylprolyl isomerase n=1 Tax=Phyllosticta citribraziliensis TaxID=989973 RepID=A0ABR1LCS2_9PEZI